jgi:hypothetical protein
MVISKTLQKISVAAGSAAFVVLGIFGGLEQVQAATIGSASYTWTGTENTQTQRLFRTEPASTAPTPKTFPGLYGTVGSYGYKTFSFFNNGPESAVTVDVSSIVPNFSTHFIAYLNSYDPTNQALNYLGDIGSSLPRPFSFLVPENQQFLVVAQTTTSLATNVGSNFAFNVATTPIPTPAMLPGLVVVGIGLWRKRKSTIA